MKKLIIMAITSGLIYTSLNASAQFTRDNYVVIDSTNKLMWQDDSSAKAITKPLITDKNFNAKDYLNTSGDTAATYCENLNLSGYKDYRLPTIEELNTIIDEKTLSVNKEFKNVASYNYWSSSSKKSQYSDAWYLYSYLGYKDVHAKNYSLYVRCVRDNKLMAKK